MVALYTVAINPNDTGMGTIHLVANTEIVTGRLTSFPEIYWFDRYWQGNICPVATVTPFCFVIRLILAK